MLINTEMIIKKHDSERFEILSIDRVEVVDCLVKLHSNNRSVSIGKSKVDFINTGIGTNYGCTLILIMEDSDGFETCAEIKNYSDIKKYFIHKYIRTIRYNEKE